MPRRYPVELRRKVLDLIEAGMPLTEIVVQLGLYRAARDLGDRHVGGDVGHGQRWQDALSLSSRRTASTGNFTSSVAANA